MESNKKSKDIKKPCKHSGEPKLKVLALHGYRQNADAFRQKTGSFRKIVHKYVEFTFVSAPHKVINVESMEDATKINIQESDTDQRGWFFNREDMTFRGIRKGGPAIGFEDTIKLIESTFEEYGPFDGILGFSQGACLTGLLCDLQHRGILKCKFNFAVMASGFKSGSLPHLKYYAESINIPTMHIFGENDQVIPIELSEDLCSAFMTDEYDPVIVKHDGGHYLPANSSLKDKYLSFFKTQLLQKLGEVEEDDV